MLAASVGGAGCAPQAGARSKPPVRAVSAPPRASATARAGPQSAPAPRASAAPNRQNPPSKQAAAAPSPCAGSDLALDQLWQAPECHVPDQSPSDNLDAVLQLSVHADGPLKSGHAASVEVVFQNVSQRTLRLLFNDSCLGAEPSRLFDVEFRDQRGASAPARRSASLPGLVGALGRSCPRPLVEAQLAPGGRATIRVPFMVSAERTVSPPALRAGPPRPGHYQLVVTVPLVAANPMRAGFDVAVQ